MNPPSEPEWRAPPTFSASGATDLDWLMRLPAEWEQRLWQALQAEEEARKMHYISSVQRIGRQEGLREDLQQGLDSERQLLVRQARRRFGEAVADNPPAVEGKPCGDFTCIVKTGDRP